MRSIIILSLIIFAFSFDHTCDRQGRYKCNTNQTCCKSVVSSTGWTCYNGVNLTCCSDGKSCCPANTRCNLIDRRCDPKSSLEFLQTLEEPVTFLEEFEEPSISLEGFTPEQYLQIATGFVKGVGIFGDVHFCKPGVLVDKVKEVAKTLMDIVKAKDYMKALKTFAESIKEVAVVVGQVAHECDATEKELLAVVDKLVAYLSNDKFPQKLINHSILNSVKLLKMVSDLKKDISAKTPAEFGVELGEFVNFALLFGY